ncbi:hypothetical protein FB451DRAFT_1491834 [Mycena latifolia]|nr:hypothetical protein FB451DRAFT_1491834 [Mycena latifolia]
MLLFPVIGPPSVLELLLISSRCLLERWRIPYTLPPVRAFRTTRALLFSVLPPDLTTSTRRTYALHHLRHIYSSAHACLVPHSRTPGALGIANSLRSACNYITTPRAWDVRRACRCQPQRTMSSQINSCCAVGDAPFSLIYASTASAVIVPSHSSALERPFSVHISQDVCMYVPPSAPLIHAVKHFGRDQLFPDA